MSAKETEYGKSVPYRVGQPGDRSRAMEQLHSDFNYAKQQYGFPDAIFKVTETPLSDGWSALAWYYTVIEGEQ